MMLKMAVIERVQSQPRLIEFVMLGKTAGGVRYAQ